MKYDNSDRRTDHNDRGKYKVMTIMMEMIITRAVMKMMNVMKMAL